MGILTEQQLKHGYFNTVGGFPSSKIIHTLAEYDGSSKCCIACTQLQGHYSDSACKQILKEWIRFLRDHPTAFQALHFNCRVPQPLFDAICCQENLTELRLKWGNYANLSGLSNLKQLQYLYLGSCPGVQDLTPITELKSLIVLYIENFKCITDYASLEKLSNLEQLVISGPTLGTTTLQDISFIPNMPNLASVWFPNTKITRHYTEAEQEVFRASGIQGIYNQKWWAL